MVKLYKNTAGLIMDIDERKPEIWNKRAGAYCEEIRYLARVLQFLGSLFLSFLGAWMSTKIHLGVINFSLEVVKEIYYFPFY